MIIILKYDLIKLKLNATTFKLKKMLLNEHGGGGWILPSKVTASGLFKWNQFFPLPYHPLESRLLFEFKINNDRKRYDYKHAKEWIWKGTFDHVFALLIIVSTITTSIQIFCIYQSIFYRSPRWPYQVLQCWRLPAYGYPVQMP